MNTTSVRQLKVADIPGIDETAAEHLRAAGYEDVRSLLRAAGTRDAQTLRDTSPEEMASIWQIALENAQKIRDWLGQLDWSVIQEALDEIHQLGEDEEKTLPDVLLELDRIIRGVLAKLPRLNLNLNFTRQLERAAELSGRGSRSLEEGSDRTRAKALVEVLQGCEGAEEWKTEELQEAAAELRQATLHLSQFTG